LFSLMLECW